MRRVIRTSAFARGELVTTLRQPRLLLTLVLGPFLVLFAFGLGYERDLPALSTLVVGSEGPLVSQVDRFIQEEEPASIDYQGTTDDEEAALLALRDGEVDLVVVLPDTALDVLQQNERAVIEVHQRSLDPVTFSQIAVAADIAVSDINDRVLEQVVILAQQQTAELEESLGEARDQLEAVRTALSEEDVEVMQRSAGQLADRFEQIADTIATGGGLLGRFGVGSDLQELEEDLRSGARTLTQLSELDGLQTLRDASDTLDQLDAVIQQIHAAEPAVVVQPFEAQIVGQTPVRVTIDRFYAPGLVALMLQHIAVTFGALALVRERQRGTAELFRVAPVTHGERLAGKGVAFLLLGGLAAAVLTVLVIAAFDVPAPASWLGFVAVVALTLLASLGYGFVVAAISRTDAQAVQLSMLLFLTAIFFAGLFMPLERIGMPSELLSWALPATYGFAGLQELMLLGKGVSAELLGGLLVIAIVMLVLSRIGIARRTDIV